MGLFGKPASGKDMRDFRRGKTSSAKAAEAYARKQAERESARRAAKAIKAGRKK